MIEESKETLLSDQVVAQKVADYLKDCHPDGVTLTVDPESVHMGEFAWRVRVRPDREPSSAVEYFEALADVEIALDEREQLKVWLVPGDPLELPGTEEQPRTIERKPAHRAS